MAKNKNKKVISIVRKSDLENMGGVENDLTKQEERINWQKAQLKRKENNIHWRDWLENLVEHRKILLPIVLASAILLTMFIGISANRKKQQQEEVQVSASPEEQTTQGTLTVPNVPLEENAYPAVNELVMRYYKALEEVDTDALSEIVSPLTDAVLIRFTEWAKHIKACPTVNIYTKPGPREDSYIAYVVAEVRIDEYEETIPGMTSFFICKNQAGNYYINMEEEIDKAEADYIEAINFQDDVKDLSNKVSVEYNQLAQGEEIRKAIIKMEEAVTKGIQEAVLAGREAEAAKKATAEGEGEPQMAAVAKKAKATAVVNMRSSDSEKADKLGKARIGDTFKVLEERANGWTKLTDGTKEFFIKSEYLEITVDEQAAAEQPAAVEQPAAQEAPATSNTTENISYVTATTTVNIRKEASETAEKLGKVSRGQKLELIVKQADGWSKIKYKGQTAYVKSDYVN